MKNHLLVLICFCFLAACQFTRSEQSQREALESRVLKVHDEAMAEMDHVFILRQNLKKMRDTRNTRPADTATQQLVEQQISALQKADDAMMQWMHWYRKPEQGQAHDSTMQYLELELKKIEQVKITMDSTLKAAQLIYQQHEPKK
jgi:hypothetical protein